MIESGRACKVSQPLELEVKTYHTVSIVVAESRVTACRIVLIVVVGFAEECAERKSDYYCHFHLQKTLRCCHCNPADTVVGH